MGRPDVPCSFVLFGDGECCDSCHDITIDRFAGCGINVRIPIVYDFEKRAFLGVFLYTVLFCLPGVCGLVCCSAVYFPVDFCIRRYTRRFADWDVLRCAQRISADVWVLFCFLLYGTARGF